MDTRGVSMRTLSAYRVENHTIKLFRGLPSSVALIEKRRQLDARRREVETINNIMKLFGDKHGNDNEEEA